MNLNYVPLLQIQRDLQSIPRGMGRFRRYLNLEQIHRLWR
jgi:hypothetical protein